MICALRGNPFAVLFKIVITESGGGNGGGAWLHEELAIEFAQWLSINIRSTQGSDVTTSLIVAEIFGKEHGKILHIIEQLPCPEGFSRANFGATSYTDSFGRGQRMYGMTKDGFILLAMGYTGYKAE
jgi:Rha family phage regulatory protein